MYDEITLYNGLDPEEDWISAGESIEIVRDVGQTELSNEQYEELSKYFFDFDDEILQLPRVEQGKIVLEWMESSNYYAWLKIPNTNQEMLYEWMD